jgi:hypothetical protein
MTPSLKNSLEFLNQMLVGIIFAHSSDCLDCFCHSILYATVRETNQYATIYGIKQERKNLWWLQWKEFTILQFNAFLAIWLYIEMKQQSNIKSYWLRKGSILYCPIISKIMTCAMFLSLTKWLLIINPTMYVRDKWLPSYNKLGQVWWLIDALWENCKRMWKLDKLSTIDKVMICYKRTYHPSC